MTKSRGILKPRRFWTEAELELLRRNYADTIAADLARALERPLSSVYDKAKKIGLEKSQAFYAGPNSGRTNGTRGASARFQKGQPPANKGKKMPPGWSPGNMAKTQFKKGEMPHTWVPIGSYRVNGDNFVELKFSDEPGPYTKRWIPVHRKVWIEANGPVPQGHVIAFNPGMRTLDPALVTLDRIDCLTFAENLKRNSFHRYGPEIVKLVQLRGVLTRQINKRVKQEESHEQ